MITETHGSCELISENLHAIESDSRKIKRANKMGPTVFSMFYYFMYITFPTSLFAISTTAFSSSVVEIWVHSYMCSPCFFWSLGPFIRASTYAIPPSFILYTHLLLFSKNIYKNDKKNLKYLFKTKKFDFRTTLSLIFCYEPKYVRERSNLIEITFSKAQFH